MKFVSFVMLFFVLLLQGTNSKGQEKPNIIFFLVDDMGWQDTSEPFWDSITPANKKFHTPNMERLAKEGVKFTNAYTQSVCTPTRVSLMTGMNAAHHKVTNWTRDKDKKTDNATAQDTIQPPNWNVNGLNAVPGIRNSIYATTLPQILRDNGYYTIISGKAHFAARENPGVDPLTLGFEKNIGGSAAGQPQSYLGTQNYGNLPGKTTFLAVPGLEKYWGTPTFLSDALTKEALLAMDTAQMKEKPFFLYMSHYAVHLPFMEDKRFIQKYLDQGLEKPEAAYATLIEGMDESLGQIMDYLEEKDLVKNTIIIFISDNGGLALPPRSGEPNTQNYPLRAGKGSLYEGGTREPLLVKWPGVTRPGTVNSQYVIIQDFFPTLLEMAGIKNAKTVQKVDGKSMVGLLKDPGKTTSSRALIWHYPNKWLPGDAGFTSYVSSIRKGNWKLIYFQKYGKFELYNLKDDIGEKNDLSTKQKQRTRALALELSKELQKAGAQMPYNRITGKTLPYPGELF